MERQEIVDLVETAKNAGKKIFEMTVNGNCTPLYPQYGFYKSDIVVFEELLDNVEIGDFKYGCGEWLKGVIKGA